ncbi:hypothetical protein [Undibacterium umbellatum]|uniref:Uncharacterized protein n=1 Tax=Undibacterium umbellatum TaxID=2762300 RepID=A0ABR6ZJR3_9BURK|nr:hypothetical protein [Undibacterium umbellatum]MBC3911605.1 hypothetical protein [Undibacterium umbellatum]
MNGYTVCSFEKNGTKNYLVLDVVVDVEQSQALLHAFNGDGSCTPFPLSFTAKFSAQDLLNEAFKDGINHVKNIEGWSGEGRSEDLRALLANPSVLVFIRDNCKSAILAADIEKLSNPNA